MGAVGAMVPAYFSMTDRQCIRPVTYEAEVVLIFQVSMYDNFFQDIINLVALFCSFSIISISPFLYGHQTECAYSRCGLTIALYSKTKELMSKCIKFF